MGADSLFGPALPGRRAVTPPRSIFQQHTRTLISNAFSVQVVRKCVSSRGLLSCGAGGKAVRNTAAQPHLLLTGKMRAGTGTRSCCSMFAVSDVRPYLAEYSIFTLKVFSLRQYLINTWLKGKRVYEKKISVLIRW